MDIFFLMQEKRSFSIQRDGVRETHKEKAEDGLADILSRKADDFCNVTQTLKATQTPASEQARSLLKAIQPF